LAPRFNNESNCKSGMSLEEARRDLVRELKHVGLIQESLLKWKLEQFGKLYDFPIHLLPFFDLADFYLQKDPVKFGPVKTLLYTQALFLHEWNSIMLNLLSGCHYAAARTLRWIYETLICAAMSTIDGSILDGKEAKPMMLERFQKWLIHYDSGKTHLKKKEILQKLGASDDEVS